MHDPFDNNWKPIDIDTIVSVRSRPIFGDNKIRRGRVLGWWISSGLADTRRDPFEEPKPKLEYDICLFKTQTIHSVPAENVVGFLKSLPKLNDDAKK